MSYEKLSNKGDTSSKSQSTHVKLMRKKFQNMLNAGNNSADPSHSSYVCKLHGPIKKSESFRKVRINENDGGRSCVGEGGDNKW